MVENINDLFMDGHTNESGQQCTVKVLYRELMGSLLYLSSHTRPDTTFPVNLVRHFTEALLQFHWIVAKHKLRYSVDTMGNGIIKRKLIKIHARVSKRELAVSVSSNGSFARQIRSKTSTSGYNILCNDAFEGWRSCKERCVAASITEYEYIALSECTPKLCLFCRKFFDLVECTKTIIVWDDNKLRISCAEDEEKRNESITVRYHVCR